MNFAELILQAGFDLAVQHINAVNEKAQQNQAAQQQKPLRLVPVSATTEPTNP